MKGRPINMRAEEVRAIIAGRKTQFRRVMRTQPLWVADPSVPFKTPDADPKGIINCPYGAPGDRLWVRESWLIAHVNHIGKPIPKTRPDWMDSSGKYLMYAADGSCCRQIPGCKCGTVGRLPWRPSIHMPRWASRITLEIVSVRVERLQNISRADAKAEGLWPSPHNGLEMVNGVPYGNAQLAFRALWESIHGPRLWEANPWVWVVEFRRLEGAQ